FRSERERLNDLGSCCRPAAWFGERRRGRDEDREQEKHRRIGDRHTPPLRGIQYAATYRVHHYCLWNTRSPACKHEWQLAVFRVAAARLTQGHANRFPQKRKRAQGKTRPSGTRSPCRI